MIGPGFVKICSLREPEHAEWVVELGADAFGLIFAEARRRVTVEAAKTIVSRARELSGSERPLAVGVFADASPDEVNRISREVGLDIAQLHGDEPPELVDAIELPVIKALPAKPGSAVEELVVTAERYLKLPRPPVALLVDGHRAGAAGGTGTKADWTVAAELAAQISLVLAGGLHPGNVLEAIKSVHPLGVDVSSGVERDGVKDRDIIKAFVEEARAAFATSDLQ